MKTAETTTIETIEEQIAEDIRDKYFGWEDMKVDYEYQLPDNKMLFLKGSIGRNDESDELYITDMVVYDEYDNEVKNHISLKKILFAYNRW